MLYCAIEFVGGISHVLLSMINHVLVKTKKTTKLMHHLGGSGCLVYVEWLHRSHVYGGCVCISHLWTATQE
jgi:hypothetical protein